MRKIEGGGIGGWRLADAPGFCAIMMIVPQNVEAMGPSTEAPPATLDHLQARIDDLQNQLRALPSHTAPVDSTPTDSTSSGASRLAPVLESDQGLTLHGVTLSGTLDLGVSYQSRGAPYSASASTGVPELLGKSGKAEAWNITPGDLNAPRLPSTEYTPIRTMRFQPRRSIP